MSLWLDRDDRGVFEAGSDGEARVEGNSVKFRRQHRLERGRRDFGSTEKIRKRANAVGSGVGVGSCGRFGILDEQGTSR